MAKEKKKGKSGAATNYISRARAVRKLQISLADFRRLCILKGIYPREPKNKKKVAGSTVNRTYYFVKDIQYLAHEPLLQKFREFKVFIRKLKKAIHKNEPGLAKSLEENKPVYNLDRLVKERYPTFVDAVRDLDDALSMVFLFAQMPRQGGRITGELVGKCWRLAREFESHVIRTRALRKTFLSIKGIYYQAEVHGQTVTWIVPYQFSQGDVPTDVDFRVMLTFLEFYVTLLGFVNFRLYASLGLKYPPRLDAALDASAAGLQALVAESSSSTAADAMQTDELVPEPKKEESKKEQALRKESNKRVASLGFAMSKILAKDAQLGGGAGADGDVEMENAEDNGADTAAFVPLPGSDEAPTLSEGGEQYDAAQRLFEGMRVYVSREVPRHALEFVLRSRGALVSWDETVAAGATFKENDPSVTHQIVDRPTQSHTFLDRTYVQPQWVFDSINAGRRVPPADYAPGRTLPPHLSPFVEATEDDYVPQGAPEGEEGGEQSKMEVDGHVAASSGSEEEEDGADSDEPSGDEEQSEGDAAEEDEEDDAATYQKELEAELKGRSFSQQQQQRQTGGKKGGKESGASATGAKKRKASESAEEEKELAKIMMPKRQRRLYERIEYSKKKKAEEVEKLTSRRAQLERDSKEKKAPAGKGAAPKGVAKGGAAGTKGKKGRS
eukprot:Opistho-1_new@70290